MKKLAGFKKAVWSHYRTHKRDMPWRRDTSLYAVVVSEIMLQQTQVQRVTVKFMSWMKRFPTWAALAKAPVKDVLQEWSGLGYNRRALYLKRIAEKMAGPAVRDRYTIYGISPKKENVTALYESLRELPGIGPNTAGAILAYAYNIPHPFIETNIRSIYIHTFFPAKESGKTKVSDTELMPLIQKTLADPKIRKNPREWHWALMDYGAHLKSTTPNPSRRSTHHTKQSAFKGSNRELRSMILKAVMKGENVPHSHDAQVRKNLAALVKEGFIVAKRGSKGQTYIVV